MWSKLKPLVVPLFFTFWISYFAYFWSHLFVMNEDGDLVAQQVNVWGDWAAHFTMGSAFGFRSLWLTESPFIAGARFSYPFITNLISGLLVRVHLPFIMAFVIPSFICSCLLVWAIFTFFRTVLSSTKKALIASLVFLLNGGLGFLIFIEDIRQSDSPWQTLLNPPHEYTRIDEQGIKWLSILDSMVIPQRAFVLGFPLTVFALTVIFKHFFRQPKEDLHRLVAKRLVLASLILGVMPLIHTHSFLAAGIILFFWAMGDLWQNLPQPKVRFSKLKQWGSLALLTGLISAPLYYFYFSQQVGDFISWFPGWLAQEYQMNWVVFWLKNWALTPLLALLGFGYWVKTSHQPKLIFFWFAPFIFLFTVANLWLFQPFAWDNTKLLVWAALGFSALVAQLLVDRARNWWSTLAVSVLFMITIASGTIDTYRLIRFDLHHYVMYSAEELELAAWVKTETPTTSRWLTGTQHNHWLFNLTGRQALMTYPGWLWTHGYDYSATEARLKYLFSHPSDVAAFQAAGISHIVVGPQEISEHQADPTIFKEHFKVLKQSEKYTLLEVP